MKLSKMLVLLTVTLLFVVPTAAEAKEPIPLRAGPVSMLFDADNVFLRYIRVGRHEILRGVNEPIRNENWATIAPISGAVRKTEIRVGLSPAADA